MIEANTYLLYVAPMVLVLVAGTAIVILRAFGFFDPPLPTEKPTDRR